jgi:hypothetical protein
MIVAVLVAVATVLTLPLLFIFSRLIWRVRRRGVPLVAALLSPGVLISTAVTFVAYAAIVYAIGFFSGFYFLDPDEMCATRAGFYTGTSGPPDIAFHGIDQSLFPLYQTCRWADGTTYELVPPWVNPSFFTFLAVAWLALLARPLARLAGPRFLSPSKARV